MSWRKSEVLRKETKYFAGRHAGAAIVLRSFTPTAALASALRWASSRVTQTLESDEPVRRQNPLEEEARDRERVDLTIQPHEADGARTIRQPQPTCQEVTAQPLGSRYLARFQPTPSGLMLA